MEDAGGRAAVRDGEADVQYSRIYIRPLHRKIEADSERPKLNLTEQGRGYRLKSPD